MILLPHKGQKNKRERRKERRKEAAGRLHPHIHSYPDEKRQALCTPSVTHVKPLQPLWALNMWPRAALYAKTGRPTNRGRGMVLVQCLSLSHTTLYYAGDDPVQDHPENRRVSVSPTHCQREGLKG